MVRPSFCISPDCVKYTAGGAPLTCDWCYEYPFVDSKPGYCTAWDDIYVKGFQPAPLSVTVRGVNLMLDAAGLAEQGLPYPRCRLGALNVFNATIRPPPASSAGAFSLEPPTPEHLATEIICTLPRIIRQSDGSLAPTLGQVESPTLELEVSINGRDFTDSASERAVTGGGTVRMACPAVAYFGLNPSIGTPVGGTRVTVKGVGFASALSGSLSTTTTTTTTTTIRTNASNATGPITGSIAANASTTSAAINGNASVALPSNESSASPAVADAAGGEGSSVTTTITTTTSGSDEYKALVQCGWGDYPLTQAEVLGDSQLVCRTPAHGVPESLPLRFTLNGNAVQQFDDVRFSYTKVEWIDPSAAPETGGTPILVYGYNLKPTGGGNASYACVFGDVKVPGEWVSKGVCNVLSGKCYGGGLQCLAPPLQPRMPPPGVDWGGGSVCPRDPLGRVTASSEMSAAEMMEEGLLAVGEYPEDYGRARGAFDGVGGDGKVWQAGEGVPQWLQFEFVGLGDEGHRLSPDSGRVRVAGYGITARPGSPSPSPPFLHPFLPHHILRSVSDRSARWPLLPSTNHSSLSPSRPPSLPLSLHA